MLLVELKGLRAGIRHPEDQAADAFILIGMPLAFWRSREVKQGLLYKVEFFVRGYHRATYFRKLRYKASINIKRLYGKYVSIITV